jgi:hypothetical protein
MAEFGSDEERAPQMRWGSGDGAPSDGQPPAPVDWEPRPAMVRTVSILLIVFGLLGVLVTLLLLVDLNEDGDTLDVLPAVLAYIQLVVSCVQIGSGVVLWRGITWAPAAVTTICGVNIFFGLASLFTGSVAALLPLVLNGLLIALIRRDDVQDWCRPDRPGR